MCSAASRQHLQRLRVPVQQRQQMPGTLDGRTIPRPLLQHLADQGQGFFIAVLLLPHPGLADPHPRTVRRYRFGLLQPPFRRLEVPQRAGHFAQQGQPGRAGIRGRRGPQLQALMHPPPRRQRPPHPKHRVGVEVLRLGVARLAPPGPADHPVRQPHAAQVCRQPAGKHLGLRSAPRGQRPQRLRRPIGLQQQTLLVQLAGRLELLGSDLDGGCGIHGLHNLVSDGQLRKLAGLAISCYHCYHFCDCVGWRKVFVARFRWRICVVPPFLQVFSGRIGARR